MTRRRSIFALVAACAALLVPAATAPAASAQGSQGSGGVLMVGDSLLELSEPYMAQYLPGVPLTINPGGGYNTFQIFDLFAQSYDPALHSVIVFDGGTNDNPQYPEILAGNLSKVASMVGARCMVVPTIHGFTVNGYNNSGKNAVVAQFAASRPGTQTPDWAGFEAAHPELMQSDDLHPIAEGADARAALIAQGVRACLTGSPSGYVNAPGAGAPLGGPGAPLAREKAPPEPSAAVSRAIAARLVATEVLRHISEIAGREQRRGSMGGLLLIAAALSAGDEETGAIAAAKAGNTSGSASD